MNACRRAMNTRYRPGRRIAALLTALPALLALQTHAGAQEVAVDDKLLRVCADPHNLPQSDDRGAGYENAIAAAMAKDLGRELSYTYFPQRMGFVRQTLRAKDTTTQRFKCDLIVGVPKGYELAATTRPYMHSTYALLYLKRGVLAGVGSADEVLALPPAQRAKLRFGYFAPSPAVDWLQRNGLFEQSIAHATLNGDPEESPGRIMERELSSGRIDVAVVWGPVAGYVARERGGDWATLPLKSPDPSIKFDYEIAMGVRFGEPQWKSTVDNWIAGNRERIDAILASYRIPLADDSGAVRAESK
ncbi:quinoprotein dehydrogenase-associated putative ABC transporter substrate-binding protein [Derxia gummosa]|uniref:Quinoprotein dehydrogenase-associated putative ABC transporter substrate-binding protein n=1 Tax=Derxia gummosa DSM 723 TaxID=1121388 RepID=A0A9U5H0Q2_9BURK|nr:quinoprotein dehydrogenase-associated putative ABC transporter substrate-binding protein [Derxia gummosa]